MLPAEEPGHRVTEHLAQPARAEMPEVPRPGALAPVALDQWREHRFDPPTLRHQPARPRRRLVLRRLEGREERDAMAQQLAAQAWAM